MTQRDKSARAKAIQDKIINPETVFELIKKIPLGSVSTYKILASACNSKAYRAIGTLVGKNKNIPSVPCHRIVKNNGEVGNYVYGTPKKIEILGSEGVYVHKNKVVNFDKKLFKF